MVIRIQGVSEIQNQIYYDYDTESIPLGQGGMGIVYSGRCFKQDNPNEYIPVAIKLITNTSKEMIERAMRESSIQIDHPNLLRMYGFIPNMEIDPYSHEMKPKYYIVMECLDGVSLDSMLEGVFYARNGSDISYARDLYGLSTRNRGEFTLKILKPILSGIKRLHQAGYIHRDIDPSNIMITKEGKVKIIDFGVCKPISSINSGTKLTMNGSIIGKVDYAAPEILTGDIQHHNFTTDIYALGILAFQLYTGSLPFTGENSAIMKAHLSDNVPIEKIQDQRIRSVVEKATTKEQAYRYQNIDEMWYDLYEKKLEQRKERRTKPAPESDFETTSLDTTYTNTRKIKAVLWIITGIIGLGAGIITGLMTF